MQVADDLDDGKELDARGARGFRDPQAIAHAALRPTVRIPPPSPIGTGIGAGARTSTGRPLRPLEPHNLDVGRQQDGERPGRPPRVHRSRRRPWPRARPSATGGPATAIPGGGSAGARSEGRRPGPCWARTDAPPAAMTMMRVRPADRMPPAASRPFLPRAAHRNPPGERVGGDRPCFSPRRGGRTEGVSRQVELRSCERIN